MSADEAAELYRLIRELTEKVAVLSVAIARLEAQVTSRKECPQPGLCLSLQPRVEAMERRAHLHDGERTGLTTAGKLIWAFIGSGGLAIAASAYTLLKK